MNQARAALLLLHLARMTREPPWPLPGADVLLEGDRLRLRAHGLTRGDTERLLRLRRERAAERWLREAPPDGARLLLHGDPGFPARLDGEPPLTLALWLAGEIPAGRAVAIVGSRQAAGPILDFTYELGLRCAAAGLAVVSGLARGIDGAAHRGCLAAGGRPVGVLGTGIDVRYPTSHASLHEEVRARGCLLTPYPCGTPPRPHHFPRRNRLLAALADAVVVVRADVRSGSLSTARAALDLGRDVYVVPGSPTDPLSRGSNALLRDGAHPLTDPSDLLDLEPTPAGREDAETRSPPGPEARIARCLGDQPLALEEIAVLARLSYAEARALLVRLELAGVVERTGGGTWRLAARGGSARP